jgi:hypothetical protein
VLTFYKRQMEQDPDPSADPPPELQTSRADIILALKDLKQNATTFRKIQKLTQDGQITNRQASRSWFYANLDLQKIVDSWPDDIDDIVPEDRILFLHHTVSRNRCFNFTHPCILIDLTKIEFKYHLEEILRAELSGEGFGRVSLSMIRESPKTTMGTVKRQ